MKTATKCRMDVLKWEEFLDRLSNCQFSEKCSNKISSGKDDGERKGNAWDGDEEDKRVIAAARRGVILYCLKTCIARHGVILYCLKTSIARLGVILYCLKTCIARHGVILYCLKTCIARHGVILYFLKTYI